MTKLEYYHVFEAILYGLIVAKLFLGWNNLIQNRKSIRVYWAHILLTIDCFLIVVIRYHNQLHMSHIEATEIPFGFLYHVILIPGTFYFVIHQAFPKDFEKTDFRELILNERPSIFYPLVIYTALNGIENILEQNPWWNYIPHFIFCIALLPAINIKKLWLVELLSIIAFAYFIFLLIKPI